MVKEMDRGEVTTLLRAWSQGNRGALDQLMPLVTRELRKLAKRYLDQESSAKTLQPTALVNELYLRLVDQNRIRWQDRAHFFAFAARTMRRVLVDHARARNSAKRGHGATHLAIDEARDQAEPDLQSSVHVLALHDALKTLANLDERQSRIVELRTFTGLNLRETAEVLGISVATVSREWASAKAWLYGELVMNKA